jgi:serine/threonine protein kinase
MTDAGKAFALFDTLCDLPSTVREARLAAIEDPALRARVAAMLAADDVSKTALPGLDELAAATVETARPPTHIGRYTVLGRLGEGGMGIVWEATQVEPRRRVAVKTLRPSVLLRGGEDRLQREAQALAELLHPGIPQVYEVGTDHGLPFLAMELVDGVTLDRYAAHLAPRARVALLRQVAAPVAHAHTRAVVHRDLKPRNVLVTPEGAAKVLDFGIAALADAEADRAGTAPYASPEQRRGEPVDRRADVHALGVMLAELAPDADPDLAAIIARATAEDRERRYPDVDAFDEDLRLWLEQRPVRARRASPPHLVRLWLSRNRPVLRVAAAALTGFTLIFATAALVTWTLDARARAADEQAAHARLRDLQAKMASLRAEGRDPAADLLLDTFAEQPDNQGTDALAAAWLAEARRREQNGEAERALDAWGRAYAAAPDAERALEALRGAADALHATLAWEALDATLARLHEAGHPPDPERTFRAALGRRDLGRALAAAPDHPLAPVIAALARGRPEPLVGTLTIGELDGVPPEEIARLDGREIRLHRATPGLPEVGRWSFPFVPERPFFVGPGALVLGTSRDGAEGPSLVAYLHASLADPGPPIGPFPLAAPMSAALADVDGDGQRELYAGTGPYTRRLVRLWPDFGPVHPASDQTASDVAGLVGHDLDGDGDDELIVGLGPWRAWDVRALDVGPGGARVVGRVQLGGVGLIVPIQVGDETWFAVSLSDTYRSRTYFPTGTPAAGLALLAWDGAALVERVRLPVGRDEGVDRVTSVQVADLDGDGRQDLLATLRTQRGILVARQLPGAQFVAATLGGLALDGTLQADDDPAREILVELDEDKTRFLLGVGEVALPAQPRTGEALRPPPGADEAWRRAVDLQDMGLPGPAAVALEAAASRGDAEARRAAARLRSGLSDDLGVLQLLRPLTHADAPRLDDLRAALTAARRVRDAEEAAFLASRLADHPDLPPEERADARAIADALRHGQRAEERTISLGPALLAETTLLDPMAVRWSAEARQARLTMSGDPDAAPAWSMSLARTRGPFVLDLTLDLHEGELGSGALVVLDGPRPRGLLIDVRGGDSAGVWRIFARDGGVDTFLTEGPVDAAGRADVTLRARIEVFPELRQVTYSLTTPVGVFRQVFLDVDTQLPTAVRVRAAGDRAYPRSVLSAAIRELRLAGADLVPSDPALAHLAIGRASAHLDDDPGLARAVARLETGHPGARADLLALPAPDRARLLRHYPTAIRLLPERFAEEAIAAWGDTLSHHPRHAGGCAALALGEPSGPRSAEVHLWRARCAWTADQPDRARADLLAARRTATGAVASDIALELARHAAAWGNDDDARAHLAEAVALSPTPEVTASRIAADRDFTRVNRQLQDTEPP